MKDHSISLWQEFKTPFVYGFFVLMVLLGIHNTFETLVVIDEKLYLPKFWSSFNFNQSEKENLKTVLENRVSNSIPKEAGIIKSISAVSVDKSMALNKIQKNNSEINSELNSEKTYQVLDPELNLQAAEFFAPSVGKEISGDELSGQLTVEDGKIKQISIQINSDQYKELKTTSISITAAQLMGNVFQYSMDNENYSGTIHDIGEGETYLVSFMNGPFEGIRAKFMTNLPETETNTSVIESADQNSGNLQEVTEDAGQNPNVVSTVPVEDSVSLSTPGSIVNNENVINENAINMDNSDVIAESVPPNTEGINSFENERNSPEQSISNDPSLVGTLPVENNQNPLNQDY